MPKFSHVNDIIIIG